MNLSVEQLRASADRLHTYPALLDIAGTFVLLYAKAARSPAKARSFLLSIRPTGDFADYTEAIIETIMGTATMQRNWYIREDVALAVYLHAQNIGLTVPYIPGFAEIAEWITTDLAWTKSLDSTDDFHKKFMRYWQVAKAWRYTVQDVCTILSISRMTFYYWLRGDTAPPAAKMDGYISAFRKHIIEKTGANPDE